MFSSLTQIWQWWVALLPILPLPNFGYAETLCGINKTKIENFDIFGEAIDKL